METVVIVCETMRNEYLHAEKKSGCSYETRWMEAGLHSYPDKLRDALQDELDSITHQRVLLCFGSCGNSIIGLETRDFELVMPRVDDCISMLIGSVSERMEINSKYHAFFLTSGWLRGERHIHSEYAYTMEKYGEELGESIMALMLANYKNIVLLDTGSYNITSALEQSEKMAEDLNLGLKVLPASTDYISQLLTGPHDPERFITFPPHTRLDAVPVS